LWLGDELLAPVPHRQMVFTLPQRQRPYFLWRCMLPEHRDVGGRHVLRCGEIRRV
jgi:hypothetical protein